MSENPGGGEAAAPLSFERRRDAPAKRGTADTPSPAESFARGFEHLGLNFAGLLHHPVHFLLSSFTDHYRRV